MISTADVSRAHAANPRLSRLQDDVRQARRRYWAAAHAECPVELLVEAIHDAVRAYDTALEHTLHRLAERQVRNFERASGRYAKQGQ